MLTPSLMHHLSIVPDFRQAWKVQHQLSDILFLTVCAVICGAEGWDEIEDFGHAKLDFCVNTVILRRVRPAMTPWPG